jgi:HlyD family secretion protein
MNITSGRWIGLAAVLCAAAGLSWWHFATQPAAPVLYGNVEIRPVDLAFNAEGRVTRMLVQASDQVQADELLAMRDDETYASALALAQAQLDLLLAGSRQEQIDHARAELAAGQANLAHAQSSFSRQAALVGRGATTVQSLDDARMQLDSAQAGMAAAQATLTELINGPRPQEIQAVRSQYDEAGRNWHWPRQSSTTRNSMPRWMAS